MFKKVCNLSLIASTVDESFTQVCKGRGREAAYDNVLYDVSHTARGEVVDTHKDLKHRLCEPCLKLVQPNCVETIYTGELPCI